VSFSEHTPRELPGVLWDPRTTSHRAAAYRLGEIIARLAHADIVVDEKIRAPWHAPRRPPDALGLRPYQEQALAAWMALDRRGVVVLPTGAGKTRLAIAAILETGLSTAVLCPTRALAAAWVSELGKWTGEQIGLVGDGERRLERITVMTFESAYRQMDVFGDRFGLLVVDEVHHFGGGVRAEALEASCAIARLGLTATATEPGTAATASIDSLVGPVVFKIGFGDLVGRHLAHVTVVRLPVSLTLDERQEYDRKARTFLEMRRAFMRVHRDADYATLVRGLAQTPGGCRALREHAEALELASFPIAKRKLVSELLERHRTDRTIVFTAFAENAYRLARDNLIPVIAAETKARERTRILSEFREGKLRAIASARVLNEGIDVPDARVAIVVAGSLGAREHVQRIGRVLRPAPDKRAVVYELVTRGTTDERRAFARGRHAPHTIP
jgi:superfamily II DNA or RNA helicase